MWDVFRQFLNQNQFLYYIGKHDILPPPLKGEEERKVIDQAVSGNQKARDTLIEHNLRLVVYVAKRYDNSTNCPLEDLISIGTIGLVKAINTFKADKNIKLATYASRCIENEILMYFRARKKMTREVSLYEPIGTDKEGNEIKLFDIIEAADDDAYKKAVLKEEIRMLYYQMESVLSKRERLVLKLRYGLYDAEEYTQREIAEQLGISRSYVSRIEKSAIEKLKEYF